MTLLNENPTYYDVLDLKPEASPQEIREAYLRIKSTYNKDSVALYTLISASEREDMLRLIEEAYDVLSSTEKRREYDRYHGLMDSRTEMMAQTRPAKKIVSIDRVPPMDMAEGDELLVPPTTDFRPGEEVPGMPSGKRETLHSKEESNAFSPSLRPASPQRPERGPFEDETPWSEPAPSSLRPSVPPSHQPSYSVPTEQKTPPAYTSRAGSTPPAFSGPTRAPVQQSPTDPFAGLAREIEQETEWKGLLLRRIREARKISLEEMAATTKISKTYILALEEDNYVKLPAAVYIRGFITQIARALKLPFNQVATAYMARYYLTHPKKT